MPENIDNKNTNLVQPNIRKEEIKAGVLKHKVSHDTETYGNKRTKSGRTVTFKRDPEHVYD